MINDSQYVSNFAAQLAQSLATASESRDNSASSSFSGSSPLSGGAFSTSSSSAPGMVAVSNPFFMGSLSSADQDRLRSALNRPF